VAVEVAWSLRTRGAGGVQLVPDLAVRPQASSPAMDGSASPGPGHAGIVRVRRRRASAPIARSWNAVRAGICEAHLRG
jgi:hypothetical protein